MENRLNPELVEDSNLPPGQLLEPVKRSDLKIEIQPITISHCTADLKGVYCTAGFVVTGPRGRRAGLLWDLDNQNGWIEHPDSNTRDAQQLLQNLDVLFMDCNTWEAEEGEERNTGQKKNTGHIGFVRLQQYVTVLHPKETVLIHLSGHADGPEHLGWGWSNAEWELNARAHWGDLPGQVCVLAGRSPARP